MDSDSPDSRTLGFGFTGFTDPWIRIRIHEHQVGTGGSNFLRRPAGGEGLSPCGCRRISRAQEYSMSRRHPPSLISKSGGDQGYVPWAMRPAAVSSSFVSLSCCFACRVHVLPRRVHVMYMHSVLMYYQYSQFSALLCGGGGPCQLAAVCSRALQL